MGQEEAGAGGGPIPTATGRRLRSTSAGRDCHKFQQVYSADPYTFISPLSRSLPVAQEYFAGPLLHLGQRSQQQLSGQTQADAAQRSDT
jgi:hypothetical protein